MATLRRTSLTRRLLFALIVPMAGLALALGIGGSLMIYNIVERVNDRLLAASVRSIAETLSVENGEPAVDLPPFSLGMLENDSRDNVYYSVRLGTRLITGYEDLPAIDDTRPDEGDASFGYANYRGMPVRISAIKRRLPSFSEPVVIEVAETLEARRQLRERMMAGLIILEILLLGLVVLILPRAVRLGLRPLERMRAHMETRRPDDFAPLPMLYVPLELGNLITAFNSLLARLDMAVEGMRRFTADASHQMRNPLSVLRAHIAVLRTVGTDSDKGKTSLADIEAATDRLQRLVIQLLALARADSMHPANGLAVAPVDIVALTRRVAVEEAPLALKADIELIFECDSETIVANTAESLAVELIANLIDNAVHYNQPGGEILIEVRNEPDGVLVSIEDDGPGIAAEHREAVFTRFRRLDRDQSRAGSGLGLAIVKSLSDTIGAKVTLNDPRRRKGLRVEIRFPGNG
ncbi:MAG: sensor histidine kinase [Sphingomonadaceae bacterium]